MSILIIILGLACAGYCAWQYGWGSQWRLAPIWIWLGLWSVAIAIAQLRLSSFESPWSLRFWLILSTFFVTFCLMHYWTNRWSDKFFVNKKMTSGASHLAPLIIAGLSGLSILGMSILWSQFGTLPLLSSAPDKLRFIINREAFGLWEYLALLPRLIIPLAFYAILTDYKNRRWYWSAIVICVISLLLYASRLVVIMPLLMSYAIYVMHHRRTLTTRTLLIASTAVVGVVFIFSIAIPGVRHFITYRDYYQDVEYNPFTYLFDLADLNIPESLAFIVPIYIIPSFNLQALSHAVERGSMGGIFYGAYFASTFNPLLKILHLPVIDATVNWKALYLPWWVTATAIFSSWVDFGLIGIIGAGILWGGLLAFIYRWAYERASTLPLLLYAYFTFVVVMSIYTNYLMRPEFYMDILVIIIAGYFFDKKKSAAN